MAKKALVNTIEPRGKNNSGYRVLEVVEAGNEFETHPDLQWHDCEDTVEMDKYWYDPSSSSFKKLPEGVIALDTVGALATDNDGNDIEKYVWNWDTETWSKVPL
jgi:hypothetical protein